MPVMGGDRADAGMVVALLGPVEVGLAGGAMTAVAQPWLRVLLGLLGAAGGRVVTAEALVDGVWGEEWSPGREKNLHALVYQLRRRLAALEPGQGGARLARAGAGYRLTLGPGELDVAVFRDLARLGREAARAGDAAGARELLGQALAVWRGAALADAAPLCGRLAGEAARLEEARLAVTEERIGADLALGRHGEVAGELAGLVAEFPLRERLAALLMTALYRCGRRGEALAVYDGARRVLAGELGLDPGPELAGLQAKVLADDPALAAPAAVPGEAVPAAAEGAAAMGLPQGTVTFLFTDLEGSTRRWEAHPAEMRDALARHDTIVRGAVESHGGVVFSAMGDGMAAVFASARDAVRAVLAAQQGLAAEEWGEVTGPLAARMGLLTDEGVLGGEQYLNPPLNRCARLMAAGHGGQALVSGATELLVRDDLPDGCALVDLGEHRLRDLARPVRIFQLTGPGLRDQFPPLRTLEGFAGNLPVQLSSFVGRAGELAGLAAAMAGSPLVTVTGPGGVGKTRLALQAAADQLPSFTDGAWLCELAAAGDGETMAQAVAAALRVRPRPAMSTAGSVVEFLRTRSALLLVLDNCEHLAAAAAALAADILRSCRGVRILATSQQPLAVGGEQVFGLRPLSLPPPEATMAAAGATDAVVLFVQRAAAARGDFSLSASNVAAVGEICRRLDGIPLAIELAAARVAALRPAEIAALLDERFRLLTRGRADAARRQQTLQATVEWSYALLGQNERRVFDGLGVFPASFDAAAAADIAGAGGLQRWDVLDSLTSLVGKSLVAEEEGPGQTSRYRLLETMRVYARQQLAAAGELDRLRHRHAEHYAALAGRAGPELAGPAQLDWQPRIRAERDNLQAAVTWALASGGQARPLAFRIVAALAGFAITSPGTAAGWADACLAQIGECPPELRGMVLAAAAWSAFWAGDLPLVQRRAEDALQDPAVGDPLSLGLLRIALAQTYTLTGQPERGARIARQARQEAAEQGIEILVGNFLAAEAMAWTRAGDYAAARQPAMEAVEVARRVQNPSLSAFAFTAAAGTIWPGDRQTALRLIEDSLALTRAGAFDPFLGIALAWAGFIRAQTGDLPGALAVLQEAMAQQHADGNRLLLGSTLQAAAVVLARLGQAEPAAVLSGAYSANFPPGITPVHQDETMGIGEAQSLARRALGEAAYSAALARGAAMDDDEVVGYAQDQYRRLAALRAQPRAQAPDSPPGPARPSRRE
jgi:predicted ATPase/class 3 adenylate cyclase